MDEKEIEKRKPTYRDFPPTKETDTFKLWDITNLVIDNSNIPSDITLKIHYDKGERVYEARVYPLPNDEEIKILSKININTGNINMIIKTGKAILMPPENKSFTKAEYESQIKKIEGFLSKHIDISKVTITDSKSINEEMEKFVKKHKKELKKQ